MNRFRRVTVFGGSGFIGRYVVRRLAERGAVVAVAGRHAGKATWLLPMGDVGQIVLVNTAIDDEGGIAAVLAGADTVVNLVGILHPERNFEAVHAEGPARIARLASRAGVKQLVHLSAIGADAKSDSSYARSKAAGEVAVRDAFPAASVLRPSLVFGPEDQFFNRFARMAQFAPALPLIGGGLTRFQPVYVSDVADAVLACLDRPDAVGGTFELGGPGIYSFRELMQLMFRMIGRERPLLTVSTGLAMLQASIAELLPDPPLTRDQVRLLQHDNVVEPGARTLVDLGISPAALELVLPSYLDRFKRGGRFSKVPH